MPDMAVAASDTAAAEPDTAAVHTAQVRIAVPDTVAPAAVGIASVDTVASAAVGIAVPAGWGQNTDFPSLSSFHHAAV